MRIKEMKRLGALAGEGEGEGEESAADEEGKGDGINEPEYFEGRRGYDPRFLKDYPVPLPDNKRAADEVQRDDGEGSVLTYTNFSVVMSRSRKLAFYVCCNIDGRQSAKTRRTGSRWFYDGRIPLEYQIGNEAYLANRLDRGHLVRREDPIWGPEAQQANADSFHYTNCAPQHAVLNQKIWLGLENYILNNARAHDLRVSVFTGPVFRNKDRWYRDIQVPGEYWKVVTVRSGERRSATAYLLSQESLIRGDLDDEAFEYGPYRTYQVSIRRIEVRTHFDFGKLRDYDGFSGEEESDAADQISEIKDWEQIQV